MKGSLRALLVEDSATDAKLVVQELKRTWSTVEFERVEAEDAMRSALRARTWDVVLSDWSMPKFTAPAALRLIADLGLDVPFLIVSGTVGEDTAVEAMRAGARDYIVKERLGRLCAAIEREILEHAERAARRQAELALAESERRFRTLADSGIIGITVADVEGNVVEANDAYLKLIGFSREELDRGEIRWADLAPPEVGQINARAAMSLASSGVATPFETETFRKGGARVPVLVGAAMLEYPRCIVFTADLTERKQAETARARAEQALLRSEEQLRHAQKMEALGRLAGGVAHDFNNLLSVILSYGDLIADEFGAGDPIRGDVEEIRMAASRAAALTRQLLIFSRQEVTQPRVIDLQEILTGLSRMLRRLVGEDVEVAIVSPGAVGRVRADPGHIEQVIMNLVVNARDAMPTGGKLTIETDNVVLDDAYASEHLSSRVGPHVMLAVTDSGTGMDRETQARIFEPFFTTKGVGKGTGLGLSTVFGIVRQSGGTIWVYSELGKGTTFKVYLPRVDGAVELQRPQQSLATLRGTETILIVEDEEQVRAIAVSVLRKQGYQILSARNAGEALLICEQHPGPIHLLLTDVVMPQMSGPELAKRLLVPRPDTKVLCMSGYTDDSVIRHGVLREDMPFLQKPFTSVSLGTRVREVLGEGSNG